MTLYDDLALKLFRVRFNGTEYLFLGPSLEAGGPIATAEQLRNGLPPFACILPGRGVLQRGRQIGTEGDITVLAEIEDVTPFLPTDAAEENLINHPGWDNV